MTLSRLAAFCAVLSLVGIPAAGAADDAFTDLDKALAAGKKSGKPIFVYVYDSV